MRIQNFRQFATVCVAAGVFVGLVGCAGGNGVASLFGSPFPSVNATGGGNTPGGTGTGGVGTGSAGQGENLTDPCAVQSSQKFVRISLRNLDSTDFIHYFLVMVAFVETDGVEGAVCKDDIDLYTSNGYQQLTADTPFGNFCLPAGSLIYFHEGGRFRKAGSAGSTGLGSAIAPAQGTSATYDEFFVAGGAQVPVPNILFFHNPGSGEGARLLVSRPDPNPCGNEQTAVATPVCQQDSFYYVDSRDQLAGSTALGSGSGRRVPAEIQGTSCECLGFNLPWATLAATATPQCNEFARGGRIEFAFVRDDTTPSFPQGVWRVTAANGSVLHDFDPRAGVQ